MAKKKKTSVDKVEETLPREEQAPLDITADPGFPTVQEQLDALLSGSGAALTQIRRRIAGVKAKHRKKVKG